MYKKLFLIIFCFFIKEAASLEFSYKHLNPQSAVRLSGNIINGDFKKFSQIMLDRFNIAERSGMKVYLYNINGGSVKEAIKIGDFISANAIPIQVSGDCFSACLIILSSGITRQIDPRARVGVHRVSFKDDYYKELDVIKAQSLYEDAKLLFKNHLIKNEIPNNVINTAFDTPSHELTIINNSQIPFSKHSVDEWLSSNCGELSQENKQFNEAYKIAKYENIPSNNGVSSDEFESKFKKWVAVTYQIENSVKFKPIKEYQECSVLKINEQSMIKMANFCSIGKNKCLTDNERALKNKESLDNLMKMFNKKRNESANH